MTDVETTNNKPKITLIWLEHSRAQRIVWLLEEIGLEYEVKAYKRKNGPGTFGPKELKQYHPLGKAPVVIVDGQTLAESAFICEYLIDKFAPQLKPAESDPNYLQYRYLMHYTEGSLMTYMILALVVHSIRNSPVPFFIKPVTGRVADGLSKAFVTPNLIDNYDYLETLLKDQTYFAGNELSGADIMLSFPIENARDRVGGWFTEEKYPNLCAWLERVRERPAYKQANDKIAKFEPNL